VLPGKSNFRNRKKRLDPGNNPSGFCVFMGTMLLTIGLSGCYAVADWRMTMEFTVVGYGGLALLIAGLVIRFVGGGK